jgi:hypothetical protein
LELISKYQISIQRNTGYPLNTRIGSYRKIQINATYINNFSASGLTYGAGECPRYWHLGFDGQIFYDNSDAIGVANRTQGTLGHGRIQDAIEASGLLAQDLLKVLPEIVDVPDTELDSDGNQRYMSVALGDTVPLLVKAIQELNTKFEEYKATHP